MWICHICETELENTRAYKHHMIKHKKNRPLTRKPKKNVVKEKTDVPYAIVRAQFILHNDLQKRRLASQNRINSLLRKYDVTEEQVTSAGLSNVFTDLMNLEKEAKNRLLKFLEDKPLWETYLQHIRGIGPITAGGLFSHIEDIGRFDNISKLLEYAGYGMNSYCKKCKTPTSVTITVGKTKMKRLKPMDFCPKCKKKTEPIIQKKTAGYASNWSEKFRQIVWTIGKSFVYQKADKSGYKRLYNLLKEVERTKHPEKIKVGKKILYSDGHIHNMAIRKVMKIFLSNLWIKWRELEGLEVTAPYIVARDGQHTLIQPFVDEK